MSYYFIAEMFFDDDAWLQDYMARVTPVLEAHGAKILARTRNYDCLDDKNNPPAMIAVLEWPSREAAAKFAATPESAELGRLREVHATSRAYMVPAEDELVRSKS
jgi:uncharacterized protein (DUF1330 family)